MTPATAEAPWWGVPLIVGVFAFLGVLLAQSVVLYTQRRAERHDDQQRWHDDRRRAYADFLGSCRAVETSIAGEDEDPWRGLLRCEQSFNEIELLGAPSTVRLAREMMERAIDLVKAKRLTGNDSEAALAGARARLKNARAEVLAQIRVELGIVAAPTTTVLDATGPFGVLRAAITIAFGQQRSLFAGVLRWLAAFVASVLFAIGGISAAAVALASSLKSLSHSVVAALAKVFRR